MKVKLYKDDGTVVESEQGIVALSVKTNEEEGIASSIFGEFSAVTLMQTLARLALSVKETVLKNYGMSEEQFDFMFSAMVSNSMTKGEEEDAESSS